MSMTLWPTRHREREDIAREAEAILSQRAWLPIYERGGPDALIAAGEIPPPPPPFPVGPSMSGEHR